MIGKGEGEFVAKEKIFFFFFFLIKIEELILKKKLNTDVAFKKCQIIFLIAF